MATNNEYVVKITASTNEFNTQVTKSQKIAQAFHNTAQGMSVSLSGIGTASRTAASGFNKISTSMKTLAKTSVTVNSALGGILKRLLAFASAGALAGFTKSSLQKMSRLETESFLAKAAIFPMTADLMFTEKVSLHWEKTQ